jgi:phosphoribosylformylglycinamidine cyclo-ligase
MSGPISYKKAGVDIDAADAAKRRMAASLDAGDARVLNKLGAFAAVFEADFGAYEHPVLILKMEEPGSKQKLAAQHGRLPFVGYDLVHHLINDIIVMGAEPLAVVDCIICGHMEGDVVAELVKRMAEACRQQGCALVGGETSEQPGVIESGVYVLAASIVGVAERSKVIDGSTIREGDAVLAVASNGLHTNGYSLVRALIAQHPELLEKDVAGRTFLDAILEPHKCYWHAFKDILGLPGVHGLAHITGGGIRDNLKRVLPANVDAAIDLKAVRILPVFHTVREAGGVDDADMLRTFNLGVGMTMVVAPDSVKRVQAHLASHDCECYPIGCVVKGTGDVLLQGRLKW